MDGKGRTNVRMRTGRVRKEVMKLRENRKRSWSWLSLAGLFGNGAYLRVQNREQKPENGNWVHASEQWPLVALQGLRGVRGSYSSGQLVDQAEGV